MTKKLVNERCEYLSELTGKNIKAEYWNGYCHIVNKENGTNYIIGSKRECYEHMWSMIQGVYLGKESK